MKILEVCVNLDGGGIDRYLYNYCSRIKDIYFDFAIVDNKEKGILEEPLLKQGCKIFRVSRLSLGLKKNYNTLHTIMTNNKYDAVHVHLGYKSFLALKCAKDCGIKIRIVHAHIANVPESRFEKIVRFFLTKITKHYATNLAACGVDAAKWVWGKSYEKGKVSIHNNAIETAKYEYSSEKKEQYRKLFNIPSNAFVVGHVGRIGNQKNQIRLIDIFNEILKKETNAYLVLIGSGDQQKDVLNVQEKIKALNLTTHTLLLGVRSDVPDLLNMMDIFIFPSKYEGLPFTLIETQCNGLMAISSDNVTNQVKISNYVEFLSLSESDIKWASMAITLGKTKHLTEARQNVINAGYDIDVEASRLREYYLNLMQKRENL